MIRSNYLSTAVLAALLGTAPAWAQSTDSSTQATSPAASAQTTAKPLCSELNHPNAGKLADKDTGMAKERSSSPVHMDCIPDSEASAQSATGTDTSASTASTAPSASASGTAGCSRRSARRRCTNRRRS